MALRLVTILCLLLVFTSGADAQDKPSDVAMDEMQKHFAEAYNHGDVAAMAAAFTENAVRVTPSGIFQGREAISRGFQDALRMGLHDYTVQRTLSRAEGAFVLNVGTWQARLGDQAFHGYYTAIIVRDGDRARILEETVTVAAP